MTPEVAVVIPARDAAASLPACLDAVLLQRDAPPFVVVVAADRCRDATVRVAREHPVRPRVVEVGGPGSYAARNAGVAATTAPLLAFTDADCRPEPGWLAALTRALGSADAVGGAVVAEIRDRPSLWERVDRATYLVQAELVAEQGFAATANLGLTRKAFDRVGGFDAALASSGDLDMGRRLAAAGLRLVYADDAQVRHLPRRTWAEVWRQQRRLGAGWAQLGASGRRPVPEPHLHISRDYIAGRMAAAGTPLASWQLRLVRAWIVAGRRAGYRSAGVTAPRSRDRSPPGRGGTPGP